MDQASRQWFLKHTRMVQVPPSTPSIRKISLARNANQMTTGKIPSENDIRALRSVTFSKRWIDAASFALPSNKADLLLYLLVIMELVEQTLVLLVDDDNSTDALKNGKSVHSIRKKLDMLAIKNAILSRIASISSSSNDADNDDDDDDGGGGDDDDGNYRRKLLSCKKMLSPDALDCIWMTRFRLYFIEKYNVFREDPTTVAAVGDSAIEDEIDSTRPVIEYDLMTLASAMEAVCRQWRETSCMDGPLLNYLHVLKFKYANMACFTNDKRVLNRTNLTSPEDGTQVNNRFLYWGRWIFDSLERDIHTFRTLNRLVKARSDIAIQEAPSIKSQSKMIFSQWVVYYLTTNNRGDFLALRFRDSILRWLIRPDEYERFRVEFPHEEASPMNIIWRLRPHDVSRYEELIMSCSVIDIAKREVCRVEMEIKRSESIESEHGLMYDGNYIEDTNIDIPGMRIASRELVIQALCYYFEETYAHLRFEQFIKRLDETQEDNLTQSVLYYKVPIIFHLTGCFFVWDTRVGVLLRCRDVYTAVLHWIDACVEHRELRGKIAAPGRREVPEDIALLKEELLSTHTEQESVKTDYVYISEGLRNRVSVLLSDKRTASS